MSLRSAGGGQRLGPWGKGDKNPPWGGGGCPTIGFFLLLTVSIFLILRLSVNTITSLIRSKYFGKKVVVLLLLFIIIYYYLKIFYNGSPISHQQNCFPRGRSNSNITSMKIYTKVDLNYKLLQIYNKFVL